jgi:hypothetical protein
MITSTIKKRKEQQSQWLGLLFIAQFSLLMLLNQETQAQTCCTNEVWPNTGFETAATFNAKFPNSTITTTNNSVSVTNSFQGNTTGTGGWYLGVAAATATNAFLVSDATKASEGAQFWYVPRAASNTGTGNTVCLSNTIATTLSTVSCAANNLKVGKRYITAMDWVPFNIATPTGGTGVSQPTFEYAKPTAIVSATTFYNASGTTIAAKAAVDWANVKTSWERGYTVFTAVTGATSLNYSLYESNTSGMLIDNISLKELTMSDAGIGTVTCNNAGTGRSFVLNPVSNVGGVPNLKYNVTAPAGYTIAPTQGVYGQSTSFTLTKTTGSAIGTGALVITLADAVNTECTVTANVSDPTCATPCGAPNCSTQVTVAKN